MTLKTFFEKFDTFADAPDAVAKMREGTRALPFATVECPVGALENDIFSTNGAPYASPGHRPGSLIPHISQALKGRPIR